MSTGLSLAVGPELCIAQAAQIQAEWLQPLGAVESGMACEVTLALAGVESIDSAGLQLLLALKAQLERHGGRLLLSEPSRTVRDALSVFGLDAALHTLPGAVA